MEGLVLAMIGFERKGESRRGSRNAWAFYWSIASVNQWMLCMECFSFYGSDLPEYSIMVLVCSLNARFYAASRLLELFPHTRMAFRS
jgi:hypothetical protein